MPDMRKTEVKVEEVERVGLRGTVNGLFSYWQRIDFDQARSKTNNACWAQYLGKLVGVWRVVDGLSREKRHR